MHGVVHVQGVLALRLLHDQDAGAPSVEEDPVFLGLEGVADGGDLAEADLAARLAGGHHEILELPRGPALVLEAEHDVAVRRLEHAGREIQALSREHPREIVGADAVLHEHHGGHLDADLPLAEAPQGDEGDGREALEPFLHVLAVGLQIRHGHVPADGDRDHGVRALDGTDDRILGAVGELVDRVDLGLDVGEEDAGLPALGHLEGHDADVLPGLGAHFRDVLDRVDGVLDATDDRFLDVRGGRAGVGNPHLDLRRGEVRERGALDRRQRHQAHHQQDDHQQVAGGRMGGEEADHRTVVSPAASARRTASASSSSTGRSNMPSAAGARSETISLSPPWRPAPTTANPDCT